MIETMVILAGAVAYCTTVLVYKDGPFKIFDKFRNIIGEHLGENSPLDCTTCTAPYVLACVAVLFLIAPSIVMFFSVLGYGLAIRGLSQDFG